MKYLLEINQNDIFAHPTIRPYDEAEQDLRDKIRDEVYEEVHSNLIDEIQDAINSKERELDSMIADIDTNIEDARQLLTEARNTLGSLVAETGFCVEDEV